MISIVLGDKVVAHGIKGSVVTQESRRFQGLRLAHLRGI